MNKNHYVVFRADGGVRIYTNTLPPLGANYLTNPDLSAVSKLPPHMWKLDNGKIVPKGMPVSSVDIRPYLPLIFSGLAGLLVGYLLHFL